MATTNGAPGGIRVVVEGGGQRVLVFGHERIALPGLHPGGPVPEARVAEDQDGRRILLLGREQIPIPEGTGDAPAPSAAPLDTLAGQPARVERGDDGQTFVLFSGQRVPIPSLSLTAQEADSARVLVDDAGRRILIAGSDRVVLPAAPAASAGEPAMVLADGDGSTLLHGGKRITLPGVRLTREEAASARVFTDAEGRKELVAGERRIPVPTDGGPVPADPGIASSANPVAGSVDSTLGPPAHPVAGSVDSSSGSPARSIAGSVDSRPSSSANPVAGSVDSTLGSPAHPVAGSVDSSIGSPARSVAGSGTVDRIVEDRASRDRAGTDRSGGSEHIASLDGDRGGVDHPAGDRVMRDLAAADGLASARADERGAADRIGVDRPADRIGSDRPADRISSDQSAERVGSDRPAERIAADRIDQDRQAEAGSGARAESIDRSAVREGPPAPVPAERGGSTEADAPDLNLRSEELQEIIGFVPHWLVRWGTTLVFATVAVLFAVGWFVRYPDIVNGQAVLTTPEPPVRLVPRASGEVAHLFARDGQAVRPGDPLVVLGSAARWEDVFDLSGRLARFERDISDDGAVRAASFDPMLSLGDLHPTYAAFLQSLSDYRASSSGGYDARRVAELEQQVRDQQTARDAAVSKQRVLADQAALARRELDRARAMLARELVSQAEVDRAEADWLQRRSALQDGESAIASLEVQISSTRAQVLQLRRDVDDQGRNRTLALRAALATLRGAVARWDQENVLRAPSAGQVSLFRVLGEHQFVEEGVPLLAIVPPRGRPVGRVLLASAGAGKVEAGQRVILRLESFPSREFGSVIGRVTRVSQLPMENADGDTQYLVDVALPADLVTTYRRRLPFRQEMRADAEIVTRERRLVLRLFDQVRGSPPARSGESTEP